MTYIQDNKKNDLDDYFDLEPPLKQARKSKEKKIADSLFVKYKEESYETYPLPNVVSISSKSLQKIGNPAYIQIGRFVVPVVKSYILPVDEMDMFEVFKNCLINEQKGEGSLAKRKVWIKPYHPEEENCGTASSVKFEVYPWRNFDYIGKPKNETILLEDILKEETLSQLGNQIVRIGQEFFLRHPIVGPLKLVVSECEIENFEDVDLLDAEIYPEFGMITRNTRYSFKSADSSEIIIVEEEDSTSIREFCVKIVSIKEIAQRGFGSNRIYEKDWQRGLVPLPEVIPLKTLKDNIRNAWENKLIYPERTINFQTDQREYTVKFSIAKVAYGDFIVPEGKNLKAFRLNRDHHIKIDPGTSVILTACEKDAQPAKELTFQILEYKRPYNLEPNQLNWVNIDDIVRQLTRKLTYLSLNSKCTVNIDNNLLLIQLVSAKGEKKPEVNGAKQLWKVNKTTAISLFSIQHINLELLHGTIRFPIHSMQVIVTQKKKDKDSEDDEPLAKVILDEASITEAFQNAVSSDGYLSDKKVLYGITKRGIQLAFKICQILPAGSTVMPDNYGFLNKFTQDTKITWVAEMNGDVIIERAARQVNIGKIHEELIEAGLGGLPKELEQVILEIKLSRGDFNRYMRDLGIAPTRGIILWGPPGTGKTQIARNLGKILGISEERTRLYTGSEIWDKWVGNSEKNVVKMFASARDEQNRLGEKSQMHLLIIDEIDAFLQKRDSAKNRWETSVITTFLAQLDGITSAGKDPLNNIIVIGMTNQPHTIDEAVKREGRLGTHIHIGLPDHEGRKEIFKIHSKKLIAKGCISEDVDFEKLAELSSGKTGAFIEGIVAKAAKYPIMKLMEAKISPAVASTHPLSKVAMLDFKQAFKESTKLTKPQKNKVEFVPVEGVSIETLTDNLRQLGIVAVPAEAMQFIRDCKIATNYKKMELPNAVLLYGHPGTGKSSIARSLEKLLGLDGNRYQHFSASQLWPKRGSDLKETINAIIQPAKNASRDLGKGAPQHVVVVDEIDWIYAGHQYSEKESGAMMGQFLREIQNLFHADGYDATNLMVIGIASGNVPVEILKGFNVSTSAKLVEVKLPNAQERRVILNFYLEEFIKEDRVNEKIIQELVEMSKDKPGSFLRAWVKETVNKMYRRAAEEAILEEELTKHPIGKLLLDDFMVSYASLAGEERWKNTYL
jgi:SpoVK/Ycf46/Vps4 family AAA+-type ATPase